MTDNIKDDVIRSLKTEFESWYFFYRQLLLIGGTNPIEDVEKFKEQG